MYELLTALSIGLLPISALNFYHALQFQARREGRREDTDVNYFVWGVLCWQAGIFISCVLYLLWDFDLIYKSTQYQLAIMPRTLFVAGSIFVYQGLNLTVGRRYQSGVVTLVLLLIATVFVIGVVL